MINDENILMDKEQLAIARLTPEQWTKARDSITLFWDKVPSQETVIRFLSNSQNVLLSVEINDILVGQLIGYILDCWENNESMFFLYSIDIVETYQRQGIGTTLIKEVQKYSQMEGCTEAFVFTNESNLAAKRLYQSTGGRRSLPDDVVMFEYDWSQ